MKVLIIDDEEDTRSIASMSLSILGGVDVMEAEGGLEGIAKAEQDRPDAILLDMMMPVMDGIETLGELQKNPRTNDIPVIFLTAKAMSTEIDRLIRMGAIAVLTKPFDPTTLATQVEQILQTRGLKVTPSAVAAEQIDHSVPQQNSNGAQNSSNPAGTQIYNQQNVNQQNQNANQAQSSQQSLNHQQSNQQQSNQQQSNQPTSHQQSGQYDHSANGQQNFQQSNSQNYQPNQNQGQQGQQTHQQQYSTGQHPNPYYNNLGVAQQQAARQPSHAPGSGYSGSQNGSRVSHQNDSQTDSQNKPITGLTEQQRLAQQSVTSDYAIPTSANTSVYLRHTQQELHVDSSGSNTNGPHISNPRISQDSSPNQSPQGLNNQPQQWQPQAPAAQNETPQQWIPQSYTQHQIDAPANGQNGSRTQGGQNNSTSNQNNQNNQNTNTQNPRDYQGNQSGQQSAPQMVPGQPGGQSNNGVQGNPDQRNKQSISGQMVPLPPKNLSSEQLRYQQSVTTAYPAPFSGPKPAVEGTRKESQGSNGAGQSTTLESPAARSGKETEADPWVVAANVNVQNTSAKTVAPKTATSGADKTGPAKAAPKPPAARAPIPEEPRRKKFTHPWGPPIAPNWSQIDDDDDASQNNNEHRNGTKQTDDDDDNA